MAGSPSSPSTQVYIARDDEDGQGLGLGGGQWNYDLKDYYFGGRFLWPGFSKNTSSPRGSFSLSFDGTEFRVVGYTQPVGTSPQFQVTIDTNTAYNTSTDDNAPEHWQQWYQSPVLPDGHHTIKIDQMNGIGIDFMVLTPGPDTQLNGQTLIVDDTYNGIKYSGANGNGGWQVNNNAAFVQSTIWGGSNFMNTTHSTSTTGDTLIFSYTGSNASIYGNMLWDQTGSYSITYNVDGGSNFSQTFTSDSTNSIKEQPNYKLLDTGPLSAGNHTLTLTLSACIGQKLVVDYIIYQPAFNTLASMPNLTALNDGSSTTTSPTTAGQTSTSPPSTSSPDGGGSTGGGSSTNAGAIAGGVVGGLVFIAIVAAAVFFLLRRKRQNERFSYEAPSQGSVPNNNFGRVIPPQNLNTDPAYIIEPFSDPGPSRASPPIEGPLAPLRTPMMATKPGMVSAYPPSASYYSGNTSGEPPDDSHQSVAGSSSTGPSHPLVSPIGSGNSASGSESVDELRRRVHQLTTENRQLQAVAGAPPAYG